MVQALISFWVYVEDEILGDIMSRQCSVLSIICPKSITDKCNNVTSLCSRRDGGFTGLLTEITNSNSEGMGSYIFFSLHIQTGFYISNIQYLCFSLAVPKWLSVSSGCTLALLQRVSSFHGSLFPHLTVSSYLEKVLHVFITCLLCYVNLCISSLSFAPQLSSENMIAEFSQVLNW